MGRSLRGICLCRQTKAPGGLDPLGAQPINKGAQSIRAGHKFCIEACENQKEKRDGCRIDGGGCPIGLGHLPKYMGLDAGYHSAWIAHLLETKGIQGVIGYRRHTHKGERYGKYRFKYDPYFDTYFCPEGKHLYRKTTTREGYRQYFDDRKDCADVQGGRHVSARW